jgi:hypothetical protein
MEYVEEGHGDVLDITVVKRLARPSDKTLAHGPDWG